MRCIVLSVTLLLASTAAAAGLDRDTLLTEAPAVPDLYVVRISAGTTSSSQSDVPSAPSFGISGSVMWTPFPYFAGDVGGYYQDGTLGPQARLRYQILTQVNHAVDMAVGARVKIVGFTRLLGDAAPPHELEAIVALGRAFSGWSWMVNAVMGFELGSPGRDAEAKAFVGYEVVEHLLVGLDARLQAEYIDEDGPKVPTFDDMALAAGAAVSWHPFNMLQLQGLLGPTKALGPYIVGLGFQALVSVDL